MQAIQTPSLLRPGERLSERGQGSYYLRKSDGCWCFKYYGFDAHGLSFSRVIARMDRATLVAEVERRRAATTSEESIALGVKLLTRRRAIEFPPPGHASIVYGVIGADLIKIGVTTRARIRMIGLQVASPVRLRLAWWFPGARFDENELHSRYRDQWARGEWYHPTPALIQELDQRYADALAGAADYASLRRLSSARRRLRR